MSHFLPGDRVNATQARNISQVLSVMFCLSLLFTMTSCSRARHSVSAATTSASLEATTTSSLTVPPTSSTSLPAPTTTVADGPICCDTGDWIIPFTDIARGPVRPFVAGDWIAVLASLDESSSTAQKREGIRSAAARVAGLSNQMFVLRSSNFPNLRPGYIVAYQGPYASEMQATDFCVRAGQQIPSQCYPRLVIK